MRKIEFTKEKTINQNPKNPYIYFRHLYSKDLKYLVPWAQYDEENRLVEHFTIKKKVNSKPINRNGAIKTLVNELYDKQ